MTTENPETGERASVREALRAWQEKGATSLTVALMADALFAVAEREGIDTLPRPAPESPTDAETLATEEVAKVIAEYCETCVHEIDPTRQGWHIAHMEDARSVLDTLTGLGYLSRAQAEQREAEAVREALEAAADEMDAFRAETYSPDVFIRPSIEEYADANRLLRRHLGWQTDRISADCFDRSIRIQAARLRARAAERGSEQ